MFVGLKIRKKNLKAEVIKCYVFLFACVRTHTLFWIRCGREINGWRHNFVCRLGVVKRSSDVDIVRGVVVNQKRCDHHFHNHFHKLLHRHFLYRHLLHTLWFIVYFHFWVFFFHSFHKHRHHKTTSSMTASTLSNTSIHIFTLCYHFRQFYFSNHDLHHHKMILHHLRYHFRLCFNNCNSSQVYNRMKRKKLYQIKVCKKVKWFSVKKRSRKEIMFLDMSFKA